MVGLVPNTKYQEIREDFPPIGFIPVAQRKDPDPEATFVLRTSAPLGPLFRSIKTAAAEVSPVVDIQFTVMTTQLRNSLTARPADGDVGRGVRACWQGCWPRSGCMA